MKKILSLLVVLLTTFTSAWADDANLLPGRFSVSATRQVQFTKSNIYWDGSAFKFEANQTDYPTAWNANHVSHFFWTKSAAASYAETYSDGTCTTSDKFFADGSDAGHILTVEGTSDLYALSTAEWNYLINDRTNASSLFKPGVTVTNGGTSYINCLVIAPDNYSGTIATSYTAEEWATAEAAGLVCLPAAGNRDGSSLSNGNNSGGCWSATPVELGIDKALGLGFDGSSVTAESLNERNSGYSLRLVKTPYLCFTAQEAGSSVSFEYASGSDVKYSRDATDWRDCPSGIGIALSDVGDKVYLKGTNVTTDDDHHFTMEGTIAASGDVTSLTNGTGGDATLTNNCYQDMFKGCTSLTTAPELPATTLVESCYYAMFCLCSSLTIAPKLEATDLVASCYAFMFSGCTKLSEVTVNFTDWNWNTSGSAATNGWLNNVAETGTFTCPAGLDVTTTRDASHVPTGWIVSQPTGINNVNADANVNANKAQGVIKTANYIIKNGKKYNYAGQRVK